MSPRVKQPSGKRVAIATLLSLVIPGAGQLYNGQKAKGAAMMAVVLAAVAWWAWSAYAVIAQALAEEGTVEVDGLLGSTGGVFVAITLVQLVAAVDAFINSRR